MDRSRPLPGPLTVICAHVGDKWPEVWVHRLEQMLRAKMEVEYDFRVITDRPERYPAWGARLSRDVVWTDEHHSRTPDDPRMILNRDKPQGCWAKLDGFLPEFGAGPRIIIDLDVVIHDCLSKLIQTERVGMPVDNADRITEAPHFNGSIYSLPVGFDNTVYPAHIPYRDYPRGEQEYAAERLDPVELPGCYSYKNRIASSGGRVPSDAIVTFFHGRPTPADDRLQVYGWISETWKGLNREDRR